MIKANVISGHSNWTKILKNPNDYLNKRLKILSKEPYFKSKNHEFSVLLTNNKKMKKLNLKFRKKNKPTDVLSFPYNDKVGKNKFYLGDIIISYNYMNQPKNISNLNFKNKVVKIFIHGFLHLLGFDHKKNSDFNKMQREENKLFNLLEKKIEKII